MNPNASGISKWIKRVYDKLALFIVLFILLISAILLAVFVDHESKLLAAAQWNRPDVPPQNSQPIDTSVLYDTLSRISEPVQMSYGSNRMMVAEARVACFNCGRPIPITAKECPFKDCGALQPALQETGAKDSDLDGMPDEWEKLYGLNPMVDDASADADNDGYSNLEEFLAGTNPLDPASHPSPATKLRWIRTGRIPLPFSFQGIQYPAPGEVRYALQNKRARQDYYVKIGDKIEGYEIIGCDEKKIAVQKPGMPAPVIEDASVLKLRKDGKVIALTLGQEVSQGDMAAELLFLLDNSTYRVKTNDVINLQNNQYKVIDIQKEAVVVFDNSSGESIALKKLLEADRREARIAKEQD